MRLATPSDTTPSVTRTAPTDGVTRRVAVVFAAVDLFEERPQLIADEVFRGHVLDREAQRYDFSGQVLGVGQIAFGPLAILLDLDSITVVLAILREQDQGAA
ncbi:hypothetical protein GCM10025867_20780 [Frondihabitans sucicola]|uniref:Uncharacterized protein n=1 Tax=Frondihabitans sucicola TaxID=1268041 RepID=A0ABN6XXU0_9MICO|nr:hypothetical protein GCM10025867_20780 [Frondihabitans sucicola]